MDEIQFLSLPSLSQIKNEVDNHRFHGSLKVTSEDARNRLLERYKRRMYLVRAAQEDLAVIALEIMRPTDYGLLNHERKETIRTANRLFREAAIKTFSEKCTKGL